MPTAISHQIKLLEAYCDCSLFRRRPRPIALTRAGESLFPIVEKGLDEFSRALENIRAELESKKARTDNDQLVCYEMAHPEFFSLA